MNTTSTLTRTEQRDSAHVRRERPPPFMMHVLPPLHERFCRRGSLPLKKRKFCMDTEAKHDNDNSSLLRSCEAENVRLQPSFAPCSSPAYRERSILPASDKKIAALAFVASAPPVPASNLLARTGSGLDSRLNGTAPTSGYATDPNNLQTGLSAHLQDLDADSFLASPTSPSRRIHRPPLYSPLPGGCHGKTSRNNSYCRRLPCYKGSNFCKLHYQQHVMSGGAEAEVTTPKDIGSAQEHDQQVKEASNGAHGSRRGSDAAAAPLSPAKPHSSTGSTLHHQDKRFTGSDEEIRCQATTTRGRACAYIAVGGTKYCHLHADYDTNPPPRRGGACNSSSSSSGHNKKFEQEQGDESPFCPAKENSLGCVSSGSMQNVMSTTAGTIPIRLPDLSSFSASSAPSEVSLGSSLGESSEGGAARSEKQPLATLMDRDRRHGASSKRKASNKRSSRKKHVHTDEYGSPLLSMIATDQWYHKKVRVGTGPLTNHIGTVEKWGNGWVSVQIPDIGLHNRRSFELYLVDNAENQKEEKSESPTVPETKQGVDFRRRSMDHQLQTNASLFRCVSRDAVSPSPSATFNRAASSATMGTAVQSKEGKTSELFLPAPPDKQDLSLSLSRTTITPIRVPATPRPNAEEQGLPHKLGQNHQQEHLSSPFPATLKLSSGNALSPPPGVGFRQGPSDPSSSLLVTPMTPQKIRADTPLVDLLADQGSKGHNFDLLFGTAALERSRRTVHKPTRYEDTEMLAAIKRKRAAPPKVSLDPDVDVISSASPLHKKKRFEHANDES